MKNFKNRFGIIAFIALIMVSILFVSCGGTKISGTFSCNDDPDFSITFKDKDFVGTIYGYDVTGTFKVIDDKISLIEEGETTVFTIIDKDSFMDSDGDIWKKKK